MGKNSNFITNFVFVMKQDITKTILLPLMLLVCIAGFSQEYRTIKGRVEDSGTGKPLASASVSLKNSTLSNVTNSEGEFSLKIPQENANDTLVISYLGYRNLQKPVAEFAPGKKNRVKLFPTTLDISSITVRTGNAQDLFLSAFSPRYTRQNYSTESVGMRGFYRETIRKGNKYLTLAEAIVNIHKQPYTKDADDNISIYKGRGNTNRNASDTIFMQLQGGPLSTLYLDVVKDPFIAVDMLSATSYYNFSAGPVMFMDNMNIYTIDFNQDKETEEILYRGRIYIESQSLAVVRIEFEMNVEGRRNAWKEFIRKKPSDVNIDVERARYQINYKQGKDNKWHFDYARIDLRFKGKYKGKWMKNNYDIQTELAITDLENDAALKIPSAERFRMKEILQNEIKAFEDESFWGNYNVIEPDEKIENIIRKIRRQLK